VAAAVTAARNAFENGWSDIAPSERAKYLFRIARILQERSREFAVLESLNGGKPIKESRDVDLPLRPRTSSTTPAGPTSSSTHSEPAATATRRRRARSSRGTSRCSCSLGRSRLRSAAGNTVVLKPAETTPLSALLFCDVLRQAELPPGVVNIVTATGAPAPRSSSRQEVDKVAFTGLDRRSARRSSASSQAPGKKLTLELGGKAANIIFDDAALDQAVEGIVNGHLLQPGPRLLRRARAYSCRSRFTSRSSTS
jgi:aldehyde dehydrogenase (NAD+)